MEVTGARSSLDGAKAVLERRALAGHGDFDDYLVPQQAMLARKWFLTSPLRIATGRWTAWPAATM
jgi:hypothetical protein